jgi:hypothetical protein
MSHIFCNWDPSLETSKIQEMLDDGRAILVCDAWAVRQHHVLTLNQFNRIVRYYQGLASKKYSQLILFRGQTRDYLEHNILSIKPVAYRDSNQIVHQFFSDDTELSKAVLNWCEILQCTFNLPMEQGLHFPIESQKDQIVSRFVIDKSLPARFSNNPIFTGLLQHYGFPTPCLDVSIDPFVALWFALHKAVINEDGGIHFKPIKYDVGSFSANSNSRASHEFPSVYIYLEKNSQGIIFDLREVPGIGDLAVRPYRQQAFSIPFLVARPSMFVYFGSPGTPTVSTGYTHHEPTAVIKIHFDSDVLSNIDKPLNQDWLFPVADPVYQALLCSNAPYLIKY